MRSASLWAGKMIESSGESGWYGPEMDPPQFGKGGTLPLHSVSLTVAEEEG